MLAKHHIVETAPTGEDEGCSIEQAGYDSVIESQ
jgi:hypothetical protein